MVMMLDELTWTTANGPQIPDQSPIYDVLASPSVTGPVIPILSEFDIPSANEQIESLNDDVTLILPKDATPTQIGQFEDQIDKINPDYKTCQNADNVNLTESCNATFIVIPLVEEPSELIEIRQAFDF